MGITDKATPAAGSKAEQRVKAAADAAEREKAEKAEKAEKERARRERTRAQKQAEKLARIETKRYNEAKAALVDLKGLDDDLIEVFDELREVLEDAYESKGRRIPLPLMMVLILLRKVLQVVLKQDRKPAKKKAAAKKGK